MLVRVLLYLILFFLPWQTRWIIEQGRINNGPWEYGTISLYGLDILIIITLFVFLGSSLKQKIKTTNWKKALPLLVFLVYLTILNPFSLSSLLSTQKIITLILGLVLIFILYYSEMKIRPAVLALVSGASLSGLLGIWQFISQKTLASKWLGLAFHDAAALGTSVVEATAPDGLVERWLRAYGSLDHPNMFGGLMAVTLVLSFWLWLSRTSLQKKWESLVIIISLVITSAGTMLSFSRTAWISAGLGIIILLISYRPPEKKKWLEVAVALLIIIAIKGLILSQYYYIFRPRLEANTRLEQISLTERTSSFDDAKKLLKQKPWFGFGPGTYTLALHDNLDTKKLNWYYQPVHNTFLLLTIETGIFGLIFGLIVVGSLLFSLLRSATREHKSIVIALTLSLLIISLFDHWLISLHFGLLFLAAIFGLLLMLNKEPLLTE